MENDETVGDGLFEHPSKRKVTFWSIIALADAPAAVKRMEHRDESLDKKSAVDGVHVLLLDVMLQLESRDGVVFGLICHKEYSKP